MVEDDKGGGDIGFLFQMLDDTIDVEIATITTELEVQMDVQETLVVLAVNHNKLRDILSFQDIVYHFPCIHCFARIWAPCQQNNLIVSRGKGVNKCGKDIVHFVEEFLLLLFLLLDREIVLLLGYGDLAVVVFEGDLLVLKMVRLVVELEFLGLVVDFVATAELSFRLSGFLWAFSVVLVLLGKFIYIIKFFSY